MFGWTGNVLKVNLSTRQHEVIHLSDEIYRQYIGGRGLAGYFLRQAVDFAWDDARMPLLFFSGPLTGTRAPASGHVVLASRSPLTNLLCDESVGGTLGTRLKAAGFDGVIITGESAGWIGLEIGNNSVVFRDAASLVDKDIAATTLAVDPGCSVAAIGPAAKNGVRFASVVVDRYFGAMRGGPGLSFARKKLKYISVKGVGHVAVADTDALESAREDVLRLTSASSVLMGENGTSALGTAALFDLVHTRRMMPTANFRRTFFDKAKAVSASKIRDAVAITSFACAGCHVSCRKRIVDGQPLPDYDALAHFSALIENDSLQLAVDANALCIRMGMDPVSAAGVLACYMEISGETPDAEQILSLLHDMATGTGLGKELGKGSLFYARTEGRPECAMTVKGLELPAFDPRGAYGLALGYATSTRGGCYLRAYPLSHEILRKPVATDRFSFGGKARINKIAEDRLAVVDSLVVCPYVMLAASLGEYARALSAVTGVDFAATELASAGERIYYGERMLNARWGATALNDDLPSRFFYEAGTSGPAFNVPPIPRAEFLAARARYYQVRGLDENGLPDEREAKRLGVSWIG